MTSTALRLGIDLGGTKIEAALLGPDGAERWRARRPTPAGDYRATVGAITAAVLEAKAAASGTPLTVGIGTPGTPVRTGPQAGRMKNCNSTCLNGMPLQADIEAAIGQPVRIANDANCFALSEAVDGAAAGADLVFGVIAGTGVGGGVVVRGALVEGANGLAGEWGHNPLPWRDDANDPLLPCYCGHRGCIETLVSGPGLAHEHALRHGGTLDAVAIAAAASRGDADCAATLARHAERLARALAGVINVLDPDVIVLGGGLSQMAHLYAEVPRLWGRWVISAGASEPLRTRLVPPRWGSASGVRGAAWLWPGGPRVPAPSVLSA